MRGVKLLLVSPAVRITSCLSATRSLASVGVFFLPLFAFCIRLSLSISDGCSIISTSWLPLYFVRPSLSLSLLIVTVGAKRSHVDVYETTQCRLCPLRRPSSNIVAIRWRRTTRRQRSRKEGELHRRWGLTKGDDYGDFRSTQCRLCPPRRPSSIIVAIRWRRIPDKVDERLASFIDTMDSH